VRRVEQVDQEAAVLEASAEMQVEQETLLLLLPLKETLVELVLQDLLFQELEEAVEAVVQELLE
tara:strand:+ start:318 stop:509 length:192 start_codon:yes stop_codon:yes gene_type:complete